MKRQRLDDGKPESKDGKPVIRFRNYKRSEDVQGQDSLLAEAPSVTLEREARKKRERARQLEEEQEKLREEDEVDPIQTALKLAPKKVNWDLKRDLERRMAPLHEKTRQALIALARERLGDEEEEVHTTGNIDRPKASDASAAEAEDSDGIRGGEGLAQRFAAAQLRPTEEDMGDIFEDD